jgi:hypothetical protein
LNYSWQTLFTFLTPNHHTYRKRLACCIPVDGGHLCIAIIIIIIIINTSPSTCRSTQQQQQQLEKKEGRYVVFKQS